MTETSKAEKWLRNRKDHRRQTMPTSAEIVARFAPACNCEDCIYPPQTTGISVRAGVGGRRHRKRRRAATRDTYAARSRGQWVLCLPTTEASRNGFRVYQETLEWAQRMMLGHHL